MSLLSDLFAPILASDFVTSVKNVAQGIGLLPQNWVAIDPEDAIAEGTAQTFATSWNTWMTVAIQGGFLDTAALIGNPTGDPTIPASSWCKLLASSVFNVAAIPAAFATGTWTGNNSSGSPIGPFAPGTLKFYNLDTGVTYSNVANVTFPTGSTIITISADVIGTGSNGAPTRIVLLTTVLGLAGSNPQALVGADNESGPALAARCRLKYFSLSPNGPSQAYQYAALTPSLNGGIININRVVVSPSSINGTVSMLIASTSGPPTGGSDPATIQTALYAVVVPDTVRLSVAGAAGHAIAVTWTSYYHASANINPTTELTNATNALISLFQTLPIAGENISGGGGFVYRDRIIGAIQVANPLAFQIVVAAPSTDVTILGTEVPTLGTTTGAAVPV